MKDDKTYQENEKYKAGLNMRVLEALKDSKANTVKVMTVLSEAKRAIEQKKFKSLTPLLKDTAYHHQGWTALHWLSHNKFFHNNSAVLNLFKGICDMKYELAEKTAAPFLWSLGTIFGFNGYQTPLHMGGVAGLSHTASRLLDKDTLNAAKDEKDALGAKPGECVQSYAGAAYAVGYSLFSTGLNKAVTAAKAAAQQYQAYKESEFIRNAINNPEQALGNAINRIYQYKP